jgi:hypothetical protein
LHLYGEERQGVKEIFNNLLSALVISKNSLTTNQWYAYSSKNRTTQSSFLLDNPFSMNNAAIFTRHVTKRVNRKCLSELFGPAAPLMMGISSLHQEVAMQLNAFRRIFAFFTQPRAQAPASRATQTAPTTSLFDFDPMWHGDHWQNLLSSPMDARHYVMEDWSVVTGAEFEPAGLATQVR